jgi:hypothetical protein
MSPKRGHRIAQAVARGLLKRDRLELRAVEALLSAVEPKGRPAKRARRTRIPQRSR